MTLKEFSRLVTHFDEADLVEIRANPVSCSEGKVDWTFCVKCGRGGLVYVMCDYEESCRWLSQMTHAARKLRR